MVKKSVEMSEPTTISGKSQVTVPRDVRERLGLQARDKIARSMLSNGTIVLRPKARRLARMLHQIGPEDWLRLDVR